MKPNKWQDEAAGFVYERDSSMIFSRTGTGKTLVYLKALQELIEAKEIKRAIVTAPLRVVNCVWRQEADKWQIPLDFALCTGEVTKARQQAAVADRSRQMLVNHAMLPKILKADHGADALLIDELSLFRRPGGTWQQAVRFCSSHGIRIRSGATGTPAPNGLTSLYGMTQAVGCSGVFNLGPGNDYSRNHDRWMRRFFYPTDYQQYNWTPFKETPDELARLIKPFTFTLEAGAVDLPPVVRVPVWLDLPRKLRLKYDEMRLQSKLSDEEIVAGSAGIVRLKLRQILSGFAYDADGDAVSLEDDYRLDALEEIVDEQQGQPLLVVYEYQAQLALLRKRFPDLRWIGHESRDDEQTVLDWNARKIPVLALHPYAAGHGLNLQFGGNAIAFWQLPDDLEAYLQVVARLARRGQPEKNVFSYELGALNTVDVVVLEAAGRKAATQDGLWEALRR